MKDLCRYHVIILPVCYMYANIKKAKYILKNSAYPYQFMGILMSNQIIVRRRVL